VRWTDLEKEVMIALVKDYRPDSEDESSEDSIPLSDFWGSDGYVHDLLGELNDAETRRSATKFRHLKREFNGTVCGNGKERVVNLLKYLKNRYESLMEAMISRDIVPGMLEVNDRRVEAYQSVSSEVSAANSDDSSSSGSSRPTSERIGMGRRRLASSSPMHRLLAEINRARLM